MQITEHFKSEEFDQPGRRGEPTIVYPVEWIEERLRPLCIQLEILRKALGDRPIHVISGYRSPTYNKSIGGAKLSQHMEGKAADIIVGGLAAPTVFEKARDMFKSGELRIGGLGNYPKFTHMDIRVVTGLVTWNEVSSTEAVA